MLSTFLWHVRALKLLNSGRPQVAKHARQMYEGVRCAKGWKSFLGVACIQSSPDSALCSELELQSSWNASLHASIDFCRYYTSEAGIVRIDLQRWKMAQSGEATVWDGTDAVDDRNEQHAVWFDQFKAVKGILLGRILEIGAGPFTQTENMLKKIQRYGGMHAVHSITLADPLLSFFRTHVPKCPYKDGTLFGFPTHFISSVGEDLQLSAEYDTVIMINVLEHCHDALRVLENLHAAVRPRGVLVLSERWYDTKWARYEKEGKPFWDILHPINIKRSVIEYLLSRYEPLYRRDFSYEGNYLTDEGVYFIGSKKSGQSHSAIYGKRTSMPEMPNLRLF